MNTNQLTEILTHIYDYFYEHRHTILLFAFGVTVGMLVGG